MSRPAFQRIFISYRRADTDADANALYQTMTARFGEDSIFKDVDDIPLGSNFRQAISTALAQADVMLALVGPDWLSGRGGQTVNLLDRDNDFVRIELETALSNGTPIIPVVLRGAGMPSRSDLPASLHSFADINAAEVEHRSWRRDLEPVLAAVEEHLAQRAGERERHAAAVAELEAAIDRGDWDAAAVILNGLGPHRRAPKPIVSQR